MSLRKRSFRVDLEGGDPGDDSKRGSQSGGIKIPMALFKNLPIQNHSLPALRGHEPCLWYHPMKPAFHETVVTTGHLIHSMNCKGANRRAVVFLIAYLQALAAYRPHRYSQHSTEKHIKTLTERTIAFLKECRTHNIATGNAIRWVKESLLPECYNHGKATHQERSVPRIVTELLFFLRERFLVAQFNISRLLCRLVSDTKQLDICTFGYSSSVFSAIRAVSQNVTKNLRVYCINDLPLNEGYEMAQNLLDCGLPDVQVVPIAAFSIVASQKLRPEAIFLIGAVTLTTNGAVLSRAGTMVCASTAHEYNIPVIALCYTHKFSSRCLMDPYSHNELYDPATLISNYTTSSRQHRQRAGASTGGTTIQIARAKSEKYLQSRKTTFMGDYGSKWRQFSQSQMLSDTAASLSDPVFTEKMTNRSRNTILGRYLRGHYRASLARPTPLDPVKLGTSAEFTGGVMRIDDKTLYYRSLHWKSSILTSPTSNSTHTGTMTPTSSSFTSAASQSLNSRRKASDGSGMTFSRGGSGLKRPDTIGDHASSRNLDHVPVQKSTDTSAALSSAPMSATLLDAYGDITRAASSPGIIKVGAATSNGPATSSVRSALRARSDTRGDTRRASRTSSVGASLEPTALVPLYDLTGPSLIDTVITEIGLINSSDSVTIMRDYDGQAKTR